MSAGRILTADDDPLLRALPAQRLAADGYPIMTTENGSEALAVVVLDVLEQVLAKGKVA
jgi:CheY-like chemotaxis protein